MTLELNRAPRTRAQHRRRFVAVVLVAAALVAAIYFGSTIRGTEPDYYSPARTALVNARLKFEESLAHEQALVAELRMAHRELNAAIDELAEAEDLDPDDRNKIRELRSGLLAIEEADQRGELGPERLHQSYQEWLGRMNTLIRQLEHRDP